MMLVFCSCLTSRITIMIHREATRRTVAGAEPRRGKLVLDHQPCPGAIGTDQANLTCMVAEGNIDQANLTVVVTEKQYCIAHWPVEGAELKIWGTYPTLFSSAALAANSNLTFIGVLNPVMGFSLVQGNMWANKQWLAA